KNFTDHHGFFGATGFFSEEKFMRCIGTGALGMAFGDFNADNFDHSDVDFLHGGQVEFRESGNEPIGNNNVREGTPLWGKEFKKQSLYYYHRSLYVWAQEVTLPNSHNYLDLDPTYKDSDGVPLLRMTYERRDNEIKASEFLLEKIEEMLTEMGADSITKVPIPEKFIPSMVYQHNGGGVIMGDSPDNSAVNNYMQMWDMENLFVCGASAFPHFGATNPTLTMGALTYRATEGMIKYLDGEKGMLVEAKTKTTLA